jgi:hypothetical protein
VEVTESENHSSLLHYQIQNVIKKIYNTSQKTSNYIDNNYLMFSWSN